MSAVVSPAWLDLRERADAAARSEALAARLAQHLEAARSEAVAARLARHLEAPLVAARSDALAARRARHVEAPLVIHDLGGGSGAMGRWLAPRLPGPQQWVVHDRDERLLELAVADPPDGVTVAARRSDIALLEPRDLAGADAVVASALLDILTADELAALLRACAGLPMLLALTVTGRVELSPADPLDPLLTAAITAHQRRGGRLGPDAAHAVPGSVVRPSPWRLGADDGDLIAAWLDGWVAAACEQEPGLDAAAYRERRLAQAAAGELAVTVHHADLLVLP